MPPGMMLLQLLMLLVPVGALGFFGWLGLRYVRTRERESGGHLRSLPSDELARLQDQVSSLQSDMQGLRERQDFMERLLEKPRPDNPTS